MRAIILLKRFWSGMMLVLFMAVPGWSEEMPVLQGELQWPEEWTVFAPFFRSDLVSDEDTLCTVPASLAVPAVGDRPARVVEARRVKVKPGLTFDMGKYFPNPGVGNVAYVFLELNSPVAQTVTLGLGADWWMQTWVNGDLVFDTVKDGDQGNIKSPINITNHRVDVALQAGTNVLAVRFITGKASAHLALGGPGEFAGALARIEAARQEFPFNHPPREFQLRQVFPVEEQALVMARRDFALPQTDADLAAGGLAGVIAMPARQLRVKQIRKVFGWTTYDDENPRFEQPVTLMLSKHLYPWEDRHLDAVVWTTPPEVGQAPSGRLDVVLKDVDGVALARHELADLSPNGLFFSVGFPESLQGKAGALEVVWIVDGREVGRAAAPFQVDSAADVVRAGRVPLRILNGPGAVVRNAPMTVGVPFPRGALDRPENVRLLDEQGEEMPLQVRETARWSRFGPVKWLLCDFTADLDGVPRTFYLEYGARRPGILGRLFGRGQQAEAADIAVAGRPQGFPSIQAGRLRVDETGVAFDVRGDGVFEPVLKPEALHGAFVEHENGAVYAMPADTECAIEEHGPEKIVVRRTGWYLASATNAQTHEPTNAQSDVPARFCQFVTRFVFHRDSPVIRVYHTWIFTGDGNRDRIANMGWRLPAAQPLTDGGFLTSFETREWVAGPALVQFDYDRFLLPGGGGEHERRTPGVLSAVSGNARLNFGVKDFWQNFPSELEMDAGSLTFYNWPRHNPPARSERPVKVGDAFRIRFAHEGEHLDFRLPDEYVTGDIFKAATLNGNYPLWEEGRPETVNAQGIARTEEFFIYLTDAAVSPDDAALVMRGLNDETIRAVVAPEWMCASGVFGDIHPPSPEKYPEEETIYMAGCRAPERWVERLGFYGMWVHGDYPFFSVNFDNRTTTAYRTLSKNYQGWPYRMQPFARTGDPALLKFAQTGVRQMTDANFCHYATAEVEEAVGMGYLRRQGWWATPAVVPWVGYNDSWDRSCLPQLWPGRDWSKPLIGGTNLRTLNGDCDYLWDAWYMTGYARARDVALLYAALTQHDYAPLIGPRTTMVMLPAYLDMYAATFDPWFLVAARRIAELHLRIYGDVPVVDKRTFFPDDAGHTWRPADQDYFKYSGDPDYRHVALNNAVAWSSPRGVGSRNANTIGRGGANFDLAAFVWQETDDDFYLARMAAALDSIKILFNTDTNSWNYGRAPGSMLKCAGQQIPRILAVQEQVGSFPDPWHNPFLVRAETVAADAEKYQFRHTPVFLKKSAGQPVGIFLDALRGRSEQVRVPKPPLPPYLYTMTGPDGALYREGVWRVPERVEIPAEAPAGVYRLDLSGDLPLPQDGDRAGFIRSHGVVFYPVSTEAQPEVIVFDRHPQQGTRVTAPFIGFWFYVPEDTEEFWITFTQSNSHRKSVWNPDGEYAWDYAADELPGRVAIRVAPEHRGKPWRATGGDFTIDPQIPPYFAITRSKWFNPESDINYSE